MKDSHWELKKTLGFFWLGLTGTASVFLHLHANVSPL